MSMCETRTLPNDALVVPQHKGALHEVGERRELSAGQWS